MKAKNNPINAQNLMTTEHRTLSWSCHRSGRLRAARADWRAARVRQHSLP
jgi:hypothetical protein